MFRWATRIWQKVSPHERQALIGTQKPKPGIMEKITTGADAAVFADTPRLLLSRKETHLLTRLTAQVGNKILNHQDMMEWAGRERVYGLETPTQYGGLGCSPLFHARFLRRLASIDRHGNWLHRIMVPNSLGPSQLILQHGTELQKQTFIPPLMTGESVPCFGLTGPWNGSDAASIQDRGVIETRDGVEGIRFSCEKRWITLSPDATLMGFAIRVEGGSIAVVLVDRNKYRDRIHVRYHHPVGSSFPNGHVIVDDIWIPLDECIIGGKQNLNRGWIMLMQCLQQGRGISLPSVADGVAATILWKTAFYSLTRRQFQKCLYEIPAVQKMIYEMTLRVYLGRILCEFYHATHNGSSAYSAVMKYVLTEYSREVILNSMDIFAGKGITRGRRNPILHYYLQNPIGITVEGSNPLTRHLIIPVQALFEHHEYLKNILHALEKQDSAAFYRHVLSVVPMIASMIIRWIVPGDVYRQKSALVGIEAFVCLLYGNSLRTKQHVSGLFADHLIGLLLFNALRWSKKHHSFGSDDILHKEAERFILRQYFHHHGSTPSILFSSFDTQPDRIMHVARLTLMNREFREWIEEDIVWETSDDALRRVASLWEQCGNGSVSGFQIPTDLQREVIEVDSFDTPPNNPE